MLGRVEDVQGRIRSRVMGEMPSGAGGGRTHSLYFTLLFTFGAMPWCYIPVKNGWVGKKLDGLAESGGGERGGTSIG